MIKFKFVTNCANNYTHSSERCIPMATDCIRIMFGSKWVQQLVMPSSPESLDLNPKSHRLLWNTKECFFERMHSCPTMKDQLFEGLEQFWVGIASKGGAKAYCWSPSFKENKAIIFRKNIFIRKISAKLFIRKFSTRTNQWSQWQYWQCLQDHQCYTFQTTDRLSEVPWMDSD